MLGVFAEFETNLRRERQLEGVAAAKASPPRRRAAPTKGASHRPIPPRSSVCTLKRNWARRRSRGGSASAAHRCTARWSATSGWRKGFPSIRCCNYGSGWTACVQEPRAGGPDRRGGRLVHVSATTVYWELKAVQKLHAAHRAEHGKPRLLPQAELERYCELIAALKLRTTNKAGRHLSTGRAIELIEDYGVETAQGLVKAPKGLLRRPTVNRHLFLLLLDQPHLLREPPAVRFQAEHSNDCWQFDMSLFDLRHIDEPDWIDSSKGMPIMRLFSVVDNRSGVGYEEYQCVYGEDAESALRFLLNAHGRQG